MINKSQYDKIENRKLLDRELKAHCAKQIQLNNNEGLIFLSGHPNCTIHSEPDITEPRMFLSIVFTDEANINEWRGKKSKKKLIIYYHISNII